jgi:hypothetical protein
VNLLIHADPGARSGFLGAWLTSCLFKTGFDSSFENHPRFDNIHKLEDVNSIINYSGIKIRIRPSLETIDLHTFLFLHKHIYYMLPSFTRDEYSLEMFTKLSRFTHEIFKDDLELDYSLYDFVVDFADTFNENYLIDLYKKIVGKDPTEEMINCLIETNKLNKITIQKNHTCSIVKLCATQEQNLGLTEENRNWSIVDVYNTTPVDKLYDTILQYIVPDNYRKDNS